ncbi:hypothetical protein [Streptomyces sp. NPDC093225]|uniref:hypothetical protein n=1 Tax=Streptomyces sp. NPDC093225 TaxID=3366034 RepID=UPI0037F8B064
MDLKNHKTLSTVKRAAAAITLAGAALGLASTAAQAAPLPELPNVPLAGMPDVLDVPTAGVPDLTGAKLPALPAAEVTSQVLDLAENPDEAVEQAEFATVAADEALGATLGDAAPALTPPLKAAGGWASGSIDGL